MSRLSSRLGKLENVKNAKPVIWAFVPLSDHTPETERDKEMLRKSAAKHFGITDFYFSVFSSSQAATPSFRYIEHSEFRGMIDRVSNQGGRLGE
jgi:hypothetical protein